MKSKLLIFGGTGSLGKTLISRLQREYDISVFSRDEAKHVAIKRDYPDVRSLIGDVRDRDAVVGAVYKVKPDVVINAAALKNVPEVEEVPMEGIKTSLLGTENINLAVRQALYSCKVLTVSTDKAAKPTNSYGMAKALQERLHLRSNGDGLVCNAVRYGNVLESRGSLIPLLKQRFQNSDPVYITHPDMTRFFMTLDSSVDLIKRALENDEGGKLFIPRIRSARVVDVVDVLREHYNRVKTLVKESKIRPGEKLDEVLICREELSRTEYVGGDVYVVHDILADVHFNDIGEEFSSASPAALMDRESLKTFLHDSGVFGDDDI